MTHIAKLLKEIYSYSFQFMLRNLKIYRSKNSRYDLIIVKVDGGLGDYFIFQKLFESFDFDNKKNILIISSDNYEKLLKSRTRNYETRHMTTKYFGLTGIISFLKLSITCTSIEADYCIQASTKRDLIRSELVVSAIKCNELVRFTCDDFYKHNKEHNIRYDKSVITSMIRLTDFLFDHSFLQKRKTENFIEKTQNTQKKKYILINENTRDQRRSFSSQQWDKLYKLLLEYFSLEIHVYTNRNIHRNERIRIIKQSQIEDLYEEVRESTLVLSPETFVSHVAAFEQKKSICLLGGGDYGRFMPYPESRATEVTIPIYITNKMECYGCRWKCEHKVQENFECIKRIDLLEVINAVKKLV